MRASWAIVAALLVAAPLSAQQVDTIPVPRAVAVGGVQILVIVDGEVRSTHAQLHVAVSELVAHLIRCPTCEVTIEQTQRYRGDVSWFYLEHPEPEPEPGPDPDPEPEPEPFHADSLTVYPDSMELEVDQTGQVAALVWMGEVAHVCATIASEVGFIEATVEIVEEGMDWIVVPGDPAWWPGECEGDTAQAAFEALPAERTYAFAVGVHPEEEEPEPPDPIGAPGRPEFEALDGSTVRVHWTAAEGADRYRVEWGDGSAETEATELTIDGYTGWVCVYSLRGDQVGEEYRCNSWSAR